MSNIEITRFVVNMVEENTYLLYDEEGNAVLIDPGFYYPEEFRRFEDYIATHRLTVGRIFCTHGHFDHVFGVDKVMKTTGATFEMAEEEVENYLVQGDLLRRVMHRELPIVLPMPTKTFRDGELLTEGNMKFRVIAMPGHTRGGVCLYMEEEGLLFSGDSLFEGSIGRCDLPGGDEFLLINGLRDRILTLPGHVKVLPGHGESTTVAVELANNVYLR